MAQTAVSCDGSCIYSKFLKTFLFAFVVQLVFSCSALLTFNFSLAFKHFHFPKFLNSQTSGSVRILNPVVLKNVTTSFVKVTKIYALSGSILLISRTTNSGATAANTNCLFLFWHNWVVFWRFCFRILSYGNSFIHFQKWVFSCAQYLMVLNWVSWKILSKKFWM